MATQPTIKEINIVSITIPVSGDASLIMHKWSEKVKAEMRDKYMLKKVGAKDPLNPEKNYEEATYFFRDGKTLGFPAVAFKAAIVRVCKMSGIAMTDARQMFFVVPNEGELVKITGERRMREDMVKLNGKSADLRYRPEVLDWKANLTIRYNADLISEQQLVNLVNTAGFSCGVGEWRPERNGVNGTFSVVKGGG